MGNSAKSEKRDLVSGLFLRSAVQIKLVSTFRSWSRETSDARRKGPEFVRIQLQQVCTKDLRRIERLIEQARQEEK
jgi:hypothetical protein